MIFIILLILVVTFFLYNDIKKPKNFPPGPTWIPFVGNFFLIRNLKNSLNGFHFVLLYLSKKYQSPIISLKLGKEIAIAVLDYPTIREVLTREEFSGRPRNYFFKIRTFGRSQSGITGADGVVWKSNRQFAARHLKNLGFGRELMENLIKNETQNIIEFLKNDKLGINIGKFFAIRVLNVIWILTCGERIQGHCQLLDDLLNLFHQRGKCLDITGGILNMYPWLRFVAPEWSGYNLIQKINSKLKKMIEDRIQEHLENWTEDRTDDLMYCYIAEIKKASTDTIFSKEELTVICLDFFIGGVQTTSSTFELLCLMMIMYPNIQKEVQKEIDKNIPKDHILTYHDINKLPYTDAVIMEIQRFLPVLPVIGPRRAIEDTTLAGYPIPKDTTIFVCLHAMNRNENYWKNPDTFNPNRFLNFDGTLKDPENYAPFGLGKRRCLGELLAKKCIFHFFVETMRHFTVTMTDHMKPENENISVGLTILADYKARFVNRFQK